MEITKFKLPNGYDTEKQIIFYNGRITNGERKAWTALGYTDPKTGSVSFKRCPLFDLRNGHLVQMTKPDENGKDRAVFFDKMIEFGNGGSVLKLDPIIHYELIKRIRRWNKCSTPHKEKGFAEVKTGFLMEIDLNIESEKEFTSNMKTIDVNTILGVLLKNALSFDLVANLYQIDIGAAKNIKVNALNTLIGKNHDKFLELFESDNEGNVVALKPKLKEHHYNHAMIGLGIHFKTITFKSGNYYFGPQNLGYSVVDIPKVHLEKMDSIIEAVEKNYVKPKSDV